MVLPRGTAGGGVVTEVGARDGVGSTTVRVTLLVVGSTVLIGAGASAVGVAVWVAGAAEGDSSSVAVR